jgi:hypothetical protein
MHPRTHLNGGPQRASYATAMSCCSFEVQACALVNFRTSLWLRYLQFLQ